MCELFFRWHFEYLLTTKRSVRAGVLSQIYLDFSGVFVVLIVVLERLAVDLLLAVGQVCGQEVLRVAVADLQEFPDGAHEISLDGGGVRRQKVLEASEDVDDSGVGGHAGKILVVTNSEDPMT